MTLRAKAIRFLPLAFLAGVHGFVLVAPYLAVIFAISRYRRPRR